VRLIAATGCQIPEDPAAVLALDKPRGSDLQFRQRGRIRAERRDGIVPNTAVDLTGPRAMGLLYDKSYLADDATLFLTIGRFPQSGARGFHHRVCTDRATRDPDPYLYP
jgi:hypothetical protein